MAASRRRAGSSIALCCWTRLEAEGPRLELSDHKSALQELLQARGFRRRDIGWCAKRARTIARRFGSRSASRAC